MFDCVIVSNITVETIELQMTLYEHDAVFLAYASTVGLVTIAQFLKVRPFNVYLSVLKA